MKRWEEKKEKGNEFFKSRQYEAAVESYGEAIALCVVDSKEHLAACHQNRAAALQKLDRKADAIVDCTKALALKPRYWKAALRRALLYYETGQPERALDDFMFASVLEAHTTAKYEREIEKVTELLAERELDFMRRTRSSIPVIEDLVMYWRYCSVGDPVVKDLENGHSDVDSAYHRSLEAIKDGHYEDVISLVEEDIASGLNTPTEKLRNYALIARFCYFKEDSKMMADQLAKFDKLWSSLTEEQKKKKVNRQLRATYLLLMVSRATWTANSNEAFHFGKIKSDIEEAISLDEKNADAYIEASMLLEQTGHCQAAVNYLLRLRGIQPNNEFAKYLKNIWAATAIDEFKTSVSAVIADRWFVEFGKVNPVLYAIVGSKSGDELTGKFLKKAVEAFPRWHSLRIRLAGFCVVDYMRETSRDSDPREHPTTPLLSMLEVPSRERVDITPAKFDQSVKTLKRYRDNFLALCPLFALAYRKKDYREAERMCERLMNVFPLFGNLLTLQMITAELMQIRSIRRAHQLLK